jgi:hypothetical protein
MWALQAQKRLCKVPMALQAARGLLPIQVDRNARILLDTLPFPELRPGKGAVRKEGRFAGVLENPAGVNWLLSFFCVVAIVSLICFRRAEDSRLRE